jgi:hypothetical protein
MAEHDGLEFGAVMLLDILGAKDLLLRMSPREYIDALRAIQVLVEKDRDNMLNYYDEELPVKSQTAFFSDTMLAFFTGKPSADPAQLLETAAIEVGAAIHAALDRPMPFTYRGCITLGHALMDGQLFVGPAVNEAAALYEKANAGCVWFAPSAAPHVRQFDCRVLPWKVPMKDGSAVDTWAVNPLGFEWILGIYGSREERWRRVEGRRDQILATFESPRPEVEIKARNTADLLKASLDAFEQMQAASDARVNAYINQR